MVIKIMKIAQESNVPVPDLITRPTGRTIYKKVKELIKNISDEEVLILDFDGIKVIDPSFIDEFIVKLTIDSHNNKKIFYIKLSNVSSVAELNVDAVFNSYFSYKRKKIGLVTDSLMSNNSYYIGHLTNVEKDIIDYMNINKLAKTEEISNFIRKNEDLSDKILTELYLLRLIRKIEDDNGITYASV